MKSVGIIILMGIVAIMTGFALPQQTTGKEIFESNCSKCHGKEGTKKGFGVKSLQKSQLTTAENTEIITNGKGKMPSWKGSLTPEQINQVVGYIEELRK